MEYVFDYTLKERQFSAGSFAGAGRIAGYQIRGHGAGIKE
jgi:hypothetical protein